jgi:hypothetical protein
MTSVSTATLHTGAPERPLIKVTPQWWYEDSNSVNIYDIYAMTSWVRCMRRKVRRLQVTTSLGYPAWLASKARVRNPLRACNLLPLL